MAATPALRRANYITVSTVGSARRAFHLEEPSLKSKIAVKTTKKRVPRAALAPAALEAGGKKYVAAGVGSIVIDAKFLSKQA